MPKANSGTFSYPGGKTTIAPWIVGHFPDHEVYVEPFGGSASTFMFKPRSPVEVYNDINNHCTTFFEAIKNHSEELAEWVETTPYSRDLYETWRDEFQQGNVPEDTVEHAGRFWFLQTASYGGKLPEEGGSFATQKRPTQGECQYRPTYWRRMAGHADRLQERFASVIIESQDYQDVVRRYDGDDVLFYFDPPYVDVGDQYYTGESFNHSQFVDTLYDIEGDFVVSYDTLPSGLEEFTIISRSRSWKLDADSAEGSEKLVMNFDGGGEPVMSELGQQGLSAFTDGGKSE